MSPRFLVGSAPQIPPSQPSRLQSEMNPRTTSTVLRREPGYFDSNLASRRPLVVDENLTGLHGTPNLQRQHFELSPQRLHDPLHHVGVRHGDMSGTRGSFNSDVSVSSITPSEVEMMSAGLAVNPMGRSRFAAPLMMDMPSPLPEDERFSNVPTIFDVAPREGSHHSLNMQVALDQAPGRKGSRTTTETDPFFDVPGSHTPSTRPDMPPASSQLHIKPAPIFSLTAGAATGQEVISGNRTLEKSSVGSDETAPRKRHYEGCMLCSPLPSPSSSISSYMPDGPIYAPSDQRARSSGPPPDSPLPQLVPQTTPHKANRVQVDRSVASEFNPLRPYLELEGEVAAYGQCEGLPTTPPVIVPPAALLGEPGPDHFNPVEHGAPYATERPLYAHPAHGGSLSTLLEGDEESHLTQSRQPSHREVSRSSNDAGQRMRSFSGEHNRPQTSGSTIGTHSAELSRSPTHGNTSQHSLLGATDLPIIPPILASRAGVGGMSRNPFRRDAIALSAIQEQGNSPRRSSWRGVFGREDSPSLRTVPGTDANDIELQPTPAFRTPSIHHAGAITDPHPGQRVDRLDGAYEVVDLSGPSRDGVTTNEIQTQMRDKRSRLRRLLHKIIKKIKRYLPKDIGRYIKAILITAGTIILVLMIVLPVVYVGYPIIAQKQLNGAKLDIPSLSITGAEPNSVDILMEVKFSNDIKFDPVGENAEYRLVAKGTNSPNQKKFESNIPGRTVRPNLLGYLQKPKSKALLLDAGKGTKLTGKDGGRFKIRDVNSCGKVLETLVYDKEGVKVELHGQINMHIGSVKAVSKLDKTVTLPGKFHQSKGSKS